MIYLDVVFNIPFNSSFTYSMEGSTGCLKGMRVTAWLGKRKLTGYVISSSANKPDTDFEIKSIEKVIDPVPLFGDEEISLARWISEVYYCSLGEALSSMIPGGKRESSIPSFDPEDPISEKRIILSSEQEKAVEAIVYSENKFIYLFGITGSGKTEVFLQSVEKFLSKGMSVIYLVPEISYPPACRGDTEKVSG